MNPPEVRTHAAACRIGIDEFVAILPGVSLRDDARMLVKKQMIDRLSRPNDVKGGIHDLGTSIAFLGENVYGQ